MGEDREHPGVGEKPERRPALLDLPREATSFEQDWRGKAEKLIRLIPAQVYKLFAQLVAKERRSINEEELVISGRVRT
jgi:hypothetical protein